MCDLIANAIIRFAAFARRNPKTTVAGFAAIAATLLPQYSAQVASIAAGVGLILSADAKNEGAS